MPRFVILIHETPPDYPRPTHWDFMLEAGEVLRSWSLAEAPRPGAEIAAEPLPDHRLAYLDYEGPVSGDRGHVMRFDAGEYEVLAEHADLLSLNVKGRHVVGRVSIEPIDAQRSIFVWEGSREATGTTGA